MRMKTDTAPSISIIVPIYNVERYLRQCLDSLCCQTLQDIEILLMDDGSTDSSAHICDEYAAKDDRIRVYHKENSGYGATINIGISMARGEYIGILESDDWAESRMYEVLYAIAKEHDVQVVKSCFYRCGDKEGNVYFDWIENSKCEQIINPRDESELFFKGPSIWSAIYKREYLLKYHIRCLESPGASFQDTSFAFKVWATAERVWLTREAFVHYRVDSEVSSSHSLGKIFCICDECDEIDRYMERYPRAAQASAYLRSELRFIVYRWNLLRMQADPKACEMFRRRFWEDYKRAWRRGEVKPVYRDFMERSRYIIQIHPSPIWWIVMRFIYRGFIRIFSRIKICEGRRIWSLFWGLVRIDLGVWDAARPVFWEGKMRSSASSSIEVQ